MPVDENTQKRFKNLATVGNVLYQITDENTEDTNYFLAKSALKEFAEAVDLLALDQETKKGIRSLVLYLQGKIEKRMEQANGAFSSD